MRSVIESPFGPPVEEIPLPAAPLELVVAQVRFPTVAAIADQEFIADFQELVRGDYPVLRVEQQVGLLIGPEGPVQHAGGRLWRFNQHQGPWSLTLAADFIALATTAYSSRSDLLQRFDSAIASLSSWLRPAVCDRLGVRFVDRITDPQLLVDLPRLVRDEVRGLAALGLPNDGGFGKLHYLADSAFRETTGSELHARWGSVPAGATYDPAVPPQPSPSWVLDLDAYTTSPEDFDAELLSAKARHFCEVIYRFFRWAVTRDFLVEHGAEL